MKHQHLVVKNFAYAQEVFATDSGTAITRIELSALPETRRVDFGLKAMVVGGNS